MESSLWGDTIFGALAIIVPFNQLELTLIEGAVYDWAGHEFTMISQFQIDFLNSLKASLSFYYFDIFNRTDSTSTLLKHLEKDIILGLSLIFSF